MTNIKHIIQKFNLPIYCISGMLFDFSVYFYWLVVPVLMKRLGASPIVIGAADAVTFCIAGLFAPVMGILTDKWRGEILCMIGCVLQTVSCILTAMYYISGTSIGMIFIFLVIQGIGLAMLWSPDETLIGAESYIGEENKNISYFAMLSAFGKAVGFLFGGTATGILGDTYSLYLAAVLPLIVFLIFPRMPKFKNDQTNPKKVFQNTFNARKYPTVFYITSLILHLFAYGVIAMISNQYVDYADDHGVHLNGVADRSAIFVGVFLFTVNVVQTITFFVLGKWSYWQYKQRFNLMALGALLVVSFGLFLSPNGWIAMIFSVPMGMVAGYELQANLFYSITLSHNLGRYLGISEFIGEMTYSLSPLICGVFCSLFNKTWLHFCNITMCSLGLIIIGAIAALYKRKNIWGRFFKIEEKENYDPTSINIELEDATPRTSRSSMDTARTSTSIDAPEAYRSALLKVIQDDKNTSKPEEEEEKKEEEDKKEEVKVEITKEESQPENVENNVEEGIKVEDE